MKAEDYFNRIPDGHRNAIQRPCNENIDRILRAMIEKANGSGDCIINIGEGIYRPIPGDPVDEAELDKYLAKDLHRARAILFKGKCMRQTFDSWKSDAEYAEAVREKRRSAG